METGNPRESNSRKATKKRGSKLFKSSVVSLLLAVAIGVMVLPLVPDTSYSNSATTTTPPPSFPSSALASIKIPPNCYPNSLTPRSDASIALSPAPQNRGGKLDKDNSSNNPDRNLHIKADAAADTHTSNDHDTDHHNSNDHGHYVILFGGKGLLGPLNDTWLWNGQSWTLLHPPTSPPARYGASLVYDRQTRSDILFGGMGTSGPLNDTWSWNGTNWQQLHPTTSPPARYAASASYAPGPHGKSGDHGKKDHNNDTSNASTDKAGTGTPNPTKHPGNGKGNGHDIVLFGGDSTTGALNDTWLWNGQNWTLLHPVTSPPARYGASLTYDPQTQSDLLFGGMGTSGPLNDTWSWNGTNWQQLHPTTSPPARYAASASYAPGPHGKSGDHGKKDHNNDTSNASTDKAGTSTPNPTKHPGNGQGNGHDVVLFGGNSGNGPLNDTWSWNGQSWLQLHPVTSPSALSGTASTYDPRTKQAIFVAGSNTTSYSSDTWSWNGKNWTEIAQGAAAPSAPGDVMAAGGDHEITGTFSAPTQTNGSPVIAYVAVAEPGGAYGVTSGCNPPTEFTITGLQNGKSYVVYVYAVSEAGISPASTSSSDVVPFGKPYPPTNLLATPGNGSATITWDAPYDNGSQITSYSVYASPGGDSITIGGSPPPTTVTLSNLADGTTYTITATATNAAGSSLPSSSVTVTPFGIPSRPSTPTNVKAYPAKNAATITWSPPSGNGSPITSYTLTATPVTAAMLSADAATVTPAIAQSSSSPLHRSHASNKAVSHALSTTTSTQPNSSQPKPCLVWWENRCEILSSFSDPTQTGDPVSTWTLVHESKLQGSVIMAITCPSSSDCIAVGYLQSSSGSISPVIWRTTDAGATWTSEQLTSPASSYIELDAISCSSTADCVTVGGNGIGAGIESSNSGPTAIFDTTDGGATWTEEPPPSGVVDLSGVSCPSATICYASGTYFTSSTGSKPVVIESQDAGFSWSIVYLPSVVYGWLSRISCTSTTTCTAVGIQATIDYSTTPIQEQIGGYSYTTTDGGISWSSTEIAQGSFDTAAGIATVVPTPMDISCTTIAHCTTDGFTAYVSVTSSGVTTSDFLPFAYTTDDGAQSWTQSTLPPLPSGVGGGLIGISCAGAVCIAAGDTVDTSSQITSPLLYQSQDMGVNFVQGYLPTPPTGQTYALFGAYCVSSDTCYTTGATGTPSTSSYGVIFASAPQELTCPPLPVPQLPFGTTPAPPGSKTVVITYNTTSPLSAAVISNLQPGVTYMIEMSAGNSLGEGCAVMVAKSLTPGEVNNCSGCSIHYQGGPVQCSSRVFVIMWGQDSGFLGAILTLENANTEENLFTDLKGSGYMSIVGQYLTPSYITPHCSKVGYRGLAGVYFAQHGPKGNTITHNWQIANEIHHVLMKERYNPAWQATRIINGQPWLDTQFVVIPDGSVTLSEPPMPSACAYHDYQSPSSNSSVSYVFDLIPDMYGHLGSQNCNYVQGMPAGEQTTNLTETTSHEFAEAATDPENAIRHPGQLSWVYITPGMENNEEIADVCENLSNAPSYLSGPTQTVVQLIYSKRTNSCRGEGAGGYWQVSSGGQVFAFGSAQNYGSIQAPLGSPQFPAKIRAMASTPDGKGYWLVGLNGSVYTFGDADYYGSLGNVPLGSPQFPAPIVAMASTPDGKGYWLVGLNGSVYTFGDASYYGSAAGAVNGAFPSGTYITGIASTPDGLGYWLVDNTGMSYNFGDATSLSRVQYPDHTLPRHIVSFQALANADGFWAADAFGGLYTDNAQAYGSLAAANAVPGNNIGCIYGGCVSSMAATYEGLGYYLETRNGFIYPFGVADLYSNAQGYINAYWRCSLVPYYGINISISCNHVTTPSSYPLIAMAVSPS